jgi:ammonium transporter, Amt family
MNTMNLSARLRSALSPLLLASLLALSPMAFAQDAAPAEQPAVAAEEPAVAEPAPVAVAEAPAAEPAPAEAAEEAAPEPTVDKGDTAWMMVSTLLVVMMAVPGWHSSTAVSFARRTCCRC